MLKYDNYAVTFAEVPDEVSLYITITGCKIHCPGCNSKHLWEDIGKPLTWDSLNPIIEINKGITCVCFGGGQEQPKEIGKLLHHIKTSYPELKTCWYVGYEQKEAFDLLDMINQEELNFFKVGPYKEECGPLNRRGTNQIFYTRYPKVGNAISWVNDNIKFWKHE